MTLTSWSFVALALACVLLTHALPRHRHWVLAGASALFVASHVASARELLPFAAVLLLGYGSIELLRRTRSAAWLGVLLTLVIASFVVLKRYSFVGSLPKLPFPYLTVGLSYVLFRQIHLMVDAKQGELAARVPPLAFFNYCLSFLSFTAGPIQLFPDFARAQVTPLSLSRAQAAEALGRVVRGFVKVAVFSAIASYLFGLVSSKLLGGTTSPIAAWLFCASAVLYTLHLYANFAGYMDIVIGIGRLMGQDLPENFDQPFRARNFLEFWSRWHMTLSNWFRVYLFNPLVKVLAKRFDSSRAAPWLAVIAFFVTFLIMGVWHGSTAVFLVYGLLLGAGASLNKLWQTELGSRLGKRAYKAFCERRIVTYASRGLTFAFFALALTCLWTSLDELVGLAKTLGVSGVVGSLVALTLLAALSFFVLDWLGAKTAPWYERLKARRQLYVVHDLSLAAQILLILTVSSFFHKAPEFVYRAF
jgi:alginate O-acetyltransferase complex protein AlgI